MVSAAPSDNTIKLSDYKDVLLAYEAQYRLSKGEKRQEVVDQIIEEISTQGKGKGREDATKGLESVSQFFYQWNSEISSTLT